MRTRFNKQPHFTNRPIFSALGTKGAGCTAGRGYGGTNADKTRASVILNRMRSRAGVCCFGMLVVNVIIDGTFSCGSCTSSNASASIYCLLTSRGSIDSG